MEIRKVMVIGAGTMGEGIAQACLQYGYEVVLADTNAERLALARRQIEVRLQKLKEKGKLPNTQVEAIMSQLVTTQTTLALGKIDLIIEAVVESYEVKENIFSRVAMEYPAAIILSNTSSLSIDRLAGAVNDKGKFAGLHFFNPAYIMPLVEVVMCADTSQETEAALTAFALSLGKRVVVTKDSPGFIVNRVARPYYAEAMYLHTEYGGEVAELDAAIENLGFKLGPFRLSDMIGHDVNYAVTESVFEGLEQAERFRPSGAQLALVTAKNLGVKSGKGFYEYEKKV